MNIIGLRLTEIVVLGLLAIATGLLFMKRRPPGLVWVSVLLMGAMLGHLIYDQARWQLLPAYLILFILAIWIAVVSRKAYRVVGLLVRIVITTLLVLPAMALPLLVPVFTVPPPTGPFAVGTVTLTVMLPQSDRMVAREGAVVPARITLRYPAVPTDEPVAPYWRRDEVLIYRLPGLPWIASTHLSLVPTNSRPRSPLVEAKLTDDQPLPLVIFVPGSEDLPSDHVMILEELASHGWLVASLPAVAAEAETIWLAEQLRTNSLDQAFAGRVDTVRSVVLQTESSVVGDIGLPVVTLHADGPLVTVRLGDRTLQLAVPGATIPTAARTARYLMVRPSRLLIGSSDVVPSSLNEGIREFIRSVLTDGSTSSPVFSGRQPDISAVVKLLPSAIVLPVDH